MLKAPVEATKNFDEEAALHNIQNNYNSAVVNAGLISKSFSLLQLIAEGFKPNWYYGKSENDKKQVYQAFLLRL